MVDTTDPTTLIDVVQFDVGLGITNSKEAARVRRRLGGGRVR